MTIVLKNVLLLKILACDSFNICDFVSILGLHEKSHDFLRTSREESLNDFHVTDAFFLCDRCLLPVCQMMKRGSPYVLAFTFMTADEVQAQCPACHPPQAKASLELAPHGSQIACHDNAFSMFVRRLLETHCHCWHKRMFGNKSEFQN